MVRTLVLRFLGSDLTSAACYVHRKKEKGALSVNLEVSCSGILEQTSMFALCEAQKDLKKVRIVIIGAHGRKGSDQFIIKHGDKPSTKLPAEILGKIIKGLLGTRVKEIKVYSCYSGEGQNCQAQKLAEITQAKTIGYRAPVYINSRPHTRLFKRMSNKVNKKLCRVEYSATGKRSVAKERKTLLSYPSLFSKNASKECKSDKAVVFSALKKNPDALKYAAKSIREDKKIVCAALKRNPFALKYAPKSMKEDRDIVFLAIKRNPLALKYAAKTLQQKFKAII